MARLLVQGQGQDNEINGANNNIITSNVAKTGAGINKTDIRAWTPIM